MWLGNFDKILSCTVDGVTVRGMKAKLVGSSHGAAELVVFSIFMQL